MVVVYEAKVNYLGNESISTIGSSELSELTALPPGVIVRDKVIYVNASSTIPVELGPMSSNGSMYNFSIFGEINPKLEIERGITVKFVAINVDTDAYHNFVITNEGPPYYNNYGGMMNSFYGGNYSNGDTMSGFYGLNNSYGYMMNYLPPQSSGRYAFENVTYDFSSTGTYWYLCTYPGHAAKGMYGEIVVS
jgi:rusticyanin